MQVDSTNVLYNSTAISLRGGDSTLSLVGGHASLLAGASGWQLSGGNCTLQGYTAEQQHNIYARFAG